MLVNDYLEQQFAPIIDYNFTANVEKEFDRVAEGDITWDKMIAAFYGPFHRMVDTAIETQSDKHGQARVLGADPKTGRTVKARIGRYGPMVVGLGRFGAYVRWGKSTFASLAKGDDPYTLTLERGVELIKEHQAQRTAANTPIRSFAEDPDMLVKNGRYGAYIAYKGKNYRIPKGTKPEELTLDECLKIVAASKK